MIEQQIKSLRQKFLGKSVNVKYSIYNVSGILTFVGRSDLSLLTGSDYITVTVDRFPIRINPKFLNKLIIT